MFVETKKLGPCYVTFGTRDLGLTSGGVEFEHSVEYSDTEVDQYSSPVDSQVSKATVSVTVPLAVYDGEDIESVFYGASVVADGTDPAKTAVDVSDSIGTSISTKADILTCTPKSGKVDDTLTLFRAAPKMESLKLLYKKDDISIMSVKFEALPESDESDRLYRIGDPAVTA
ncbi:hypothetical protein [Limisalsivibrio acetivorans]|uniref:hypothetical protein n=1 Tax=Limisalsivibrio acetivorans TaxID=1304888 RepID=UPI0003B32859|nr:hypothetical protein [Limisalsivibrio acetivorans]